ncbi:class I SAM-dependent methyltransferase [Lunatimonas salinarum]|uniref:class I SAM-dependent methyltransferase n=1 Tax=Lunatimonas salinarum TaxID=1774590 RepID=UPI001AE0784E|nr:class I SAM-dependent methyltransferase [Lunatimonas salinarum]
MILKTLASETEKENRKQLTKLSIESPIPQNEKISQTAVFLKRQELTKILFLNELYQKVGKIHGVIIEFGCRWGQNLVTLTNLRGIHEPYNYNRKIIGFDTFEGFPNTDKKDGTNSYIQKGAFGVTEGYDQYIKSLLQCHENESPLPHIKKTEIIKGDASIELKKYLERNPQTVIAMAYFDFDLYEPTKKCLELIQPHLVRGSIIAFDELNDPGFPGETIAVMETLGLANISLKRNKYAAMQSYIEYKNGN